MIELAAPERNFLPQAAGSILAKDFKVPKTLFLFLSAIWKAGIGLLYD
jgi:hypothetical protein